MAKKTQAVAAAVVTLSNEDRARLFVDSIATSGQIRTDAEALLGKAKASMLDGIRAAFGGMSGLTHEALKETIRPLILAAAKARGIAENSVKSALNSCTVAILAIANGIEPAADVRDVRKFADSVRETLKDRGIYEPSNAGGGRKPNAEKTEPREIDISTLTDVEQVAFIMRTFKRDVIAAALVTGDKADAQIVERLTRNDMRPQLRGVAALVLKA